MKKPAVFLAGVGTCALAVASCSTATSPTPAPQSGAPADSSQSAPGATASSSVDPDTALTSKNGQSGPSAQSGSEDADTSVIVIVQLAEGADGEATLTSINEAVAASFPGASVTVEREYRNALRGYALRVPAGSLETIRGVGRQQQPPVSERSAASRRSEAGGVRSLAHRWDPGLGVRVFLITSN